MIFGALLKKDDIYSVEKFVWTVAHNTLVNYYRGKNRTSSSISIDVLAEVLASEDESAHDIEEKESIERLHAEIAYLSAIQRRIVISYYFANKKQEEIANFLSLPVGTVKWHLFEAKKELKRGMNTMRQHGELKFNPVDVYKRQDKCEELGYSKTSDIQAVAPESFDNTPSQAIPGHVPEQNLSVVFLSFPKSVYYKKSD